MVAVSLITHYFVVLVCKDHNGSYVKNDFVGGGGAAAGSPSRGNCDMLRVIGVVTKA